MTGLWAALMLCLKLFTVMQAPLLVTNTVFIVVSFGLISVSYIKNQEDQWEYVIFFGAFLLHLIVLFLDLYARDFVTILYSGKDTEVFYRISKQYFYGDFSETLTYYPYYLNFFYKIIGFNRMGAQYINILGWCLSMILMEKSCKALEIEGKLRKLALLFLAFAPSYLCATSVLTREGIIAAMNFLWFFCQIQWMKEGKHTYLLGCLIAPLISTGLHMSAIVFWALTVLVVALYDSEKKILCIQKKTVVIFLSGLVGFAIFMLIPSTRRLITLKLPEFDEGFLKTINDMILEVSERDGGSAYLSYVFVNGYGDFVIQTLVRIFYFYASPLPMDWRGLSDIAACAMSSLPYAISIIVSLIAVFYEEKNPYRTLMWGSILLLGGICAWGVFNAGTAMRHRDKILGIVILLLLNSIKTIRETKRK